MRGPAHPARPLDGEQSELILEALGELAAAKRKAAAHVTGERDAVAAKRSILLRDAGLVEELAAQVRVRAVTIQ